MIIKVCGMREAENIRCIEDLGIDMMGFIFWSGSKRFVSQMPTYMPTKVKRVGVFVNEEIEKVKRIAKEYELDYIQLHGSESPKYIQGLKRLLNTHFSKQQAQNQDCKSYSELRRKGAKSKVDIIKAFNIADASDFTQTEPYEGVADLFLFDTKGKLVGGNGEKFDWNALKAYKGNTSYLLSGGIGPEDAAILNTHFMVQQEQSDDYINYTKLQKKRSDTQFIIINSKCIGIDLNSRFEISPGVKDILKIKTFIHSLNRTSL